MATNDHVRRLQRLGLVGDDWQCKIQFVDLLLEQKRADVAIVNACEEIYNEIVSSRREDVCCAPLAEVENVWKVVVRREWINARVDKVTAVDGTKYIQKHDEQWCADQLSFVANVLQSRLGLTAPRMALVQRDNGTAMQSIEYLPDFRPLHDARSVARKEVRSKVKGDFVDKLAAVLAFAFFVGDFDNFVFVGRYVDNFHLSSRDDSFEPWTYFYDSPVINGGNLGTTENDFVLLDIHPSSDADYRRTAHDVVRSNAKAIAQMVGQYFEFGQAETQHFESSLSQHFEQYMHYDSLLNELIDWAIESCY